MISVVITNFNGAHLLKKNLPKIISLLEKSRLAMPADRQEYELIVVDDCSTDDSRAVLEKIDFKEADPSARLRAIFAPKNRGFAGTMDMGIRAAKAEYVFTLKTDTVPESPEYFNFLLSHFTRHSGERSDSRISKGTFRDPGLGQDDGGKLFAVSATLKTIENGKEELRGGGQVYFEKGFFLHRRKIPRHSGEPEATPESLNTTLRDPGQARMTEDIYSSWADGSASVFNKAIYEKIGGFDNIYNPFYWEDVDLGYRAWKAGYTIEYEPKAILVHDFEKGAINSHYTKEQQKAVSLRNQFIFVWKNSDLKHLLLYFLWETYHHAVALKNGQFSWIIIYWQAFIKWPQILKRRIGQKKLNKFSDDQILKIIP